jgi:hypothetical protein
MTLWRSTRISLAKLDFNVEFEILEIELGDNLGFVRTRSSGTIVPKGQTPNGSEGNHELFVVKKIDGAWKFHRYIFNAEIKLVLGSLDQSEWCRGPSQYSIVHNPG